MTTENEMTITTGAQAAAVKISDLPEIKNKSEMSMLKEFMDSLPEFSCNAFRNMFEGYRKRLDTIEALGSVDKYKVVFIGEPGKGKTTTICNWLGLLSKDKKGNRTKDAISLLTTASGRTTVAEVRIRQIDGPTRIDLEYCEDGLQRSYINAFSEQYWNRIFPPEKNPEIDIDAEIYRFIRNMVGLRDIIGTGTENAKKTDAQTMEFMKGFADIQAFTDYVNANIDLQNLKLPSVQYDGDQDFEIWLKKTFRQINNGEYAGISLPKAITLCISKRDLQMNLPRCIGDIEIIDTKGLDSPIREDLQKLLLAEDTICFLMDDLNQVPSSLICNLIKGTFRFDWDIIKTHKVSILAKSTLEGLSGVIGSEGDPELGKAIKRAEIASKCAKEKVHYNENNTLFTDPVEAYTIVKKKVPKTCRGKEVLNESGKPVFEFVSDMEYDEEAGREFSEGFNMFLCRLISNLKEKLSEETRHLKADVEKLIVINQEFKESAAEELADIRERITAEKNAFQHANHHWNIAGHLMYTIFELNHVHWARIKKLNRIYGAPGFPWGESWPNDIYTSIREAGISLFASAVESCSDTLKEICIDVRNEMLRQVTDGFRYQIDSMVKERSTEVATQFKKWALEIGFYPLSRENPFWAQAQDIYGKGYTCRIKNHYEAHLLHSEEYLHRIIFQAVYSIFVDIERMFEDTKI